jgi:TM2 domain-containing membrane protein YozV
LAFFLGQLGIHRFYVGKVGTGIVMLLLTIIGYATLSFVVGFFVLAVVGIWILVDFIMILMGKFKDKNGLLISK